jgi:hypothetical protein
MNRLFFLVFLLFVSAAIANQSFTHPSGLSFQYPDGWVVRDSPFADFELVPPDPGSNELGATETYFQWEFQFEPSEQKIIENVEVLIPRIVPFLKRTGEVEHFNNGQQKCIALNWSGTDENGAEVWSRVFIISEKSVTVALVALGEKQRLDSRDAAIRSILSTYQFGEAQRDQTLLGNWGSIAKEPCSNGDKTGTSEIKSSLQLNASGNFQMSESAHFTGCEEAEGKKGDYDEAFDGTWFASKNKLFLISSSNMSMTFEYQLQGQPGSRTLSLNHSTGRSQILNEIHP